MQTELTANRVSSIATGIMVFAGFGAGWLFWSLAIRQEINGVTASGIVAGMLAIFAGGIYIKRQAKRWPRVPDDPREGKAFVWINAVQWTAIFAAGYLCRHFHWDSYFPAVVTAIVALHFYALAPVFHNPLHYGTGTALVIWALVAPALLPAEHIQGFTTMGTGVLLWMGGLVTLGRGLTLMRAGSVAIRQGAGV